MKLTTARTLRALLSSLPLFGALSFFAPSFASANEPPVAVIATGDAAADATAEAPVSAPSELDEFAQREEAAQLDDFQGGDQVIITTSGVVLILVIVLLVVIIL